MGDNVQEILGSLEAKLGFR